MCYEQRCRQNESAVQNGGSGATAAGGAQRDCRMGSSGGPRVWSLARRCSAAGPCLRFAQDLPATIRIADNRPVLQTPDFATKPTLTGHKVVLRPFVDDDLPAMLAALQDPEAVKLTGSAHDDVAAAAPMDLAAQAAARDWYATRSEQADRLDLAVTDRSNGSCVGEAVLNEWDAGNRSSASCSAQLAEAAGSAPRPLS
jgi:hypothetical protein